MDDCTFDETAAREWIESVEKSHLRDRDITARVVAWVEQVSPTEILDIGAGQGILSAKLPLEGRKYVGVEPSFFLLKRATERYSDPRRQFVSGNAYALPFSDGRFDAAFSVLVWHLLRNPEMASSEMGRVLKPGGHFLILTANPAAYTAWRELYSGGRLDGIRFEGALNVAAGPASRDVLYFHPAEALASAFRQAGLVVDHADTFRESSRGEPYYVVWRGRKAAPRRED